MAEGGTSGASAGQENRGGDPGGMARLRAHLSTTWGVRLSIRPALLPVRSRKVWSSPGVVLQASSLRRRLGAGDDLPPK